MRGDRAIVERVGAARRPVYELIVDNEVARRDVRLQRADGTGGENARDTQAMQRPEVGPVRDFVRRQGMGRAVPGQEATRCPATVARATVSEGGP